MPFAMSTRASDHMTLWEWEQEPKTATSPRRSQHKPSSPQKSPSMYLDYMRDSQLQNAHISSPPHGSSPQRKRSGLIRGRPGQILTGKRNQEMTSISGDRDMSVEHTGTMLETGWSIGHRCGQTTEVGHASAYNAAASHELSPAGAYNRGSKGDLNDALRVSRGSYPHVQPSQSAHRNESSFVATYSATNKTRHDSEDITHYSPGRDAPPSASSTVFDFVCVDAERGSVCRGEQHTRPRNAPIHAANVRHKHDPSSHSNGSHSNGKRLDVAQGLISVPSEGNVRSSHRDGSSAVSESESPKSIEIHRRQHTVNDKYETDNAKCATDMSGNTLMQTNAQPVTNNHSGSITSPGKSHQTDSDSHHTSPSRRNTLSQHNTNQHGGANFSPYGDEIQTDITATKKKVVPPLDWSWARPADGSDNDSAWEAQMSVSTTRPQTSSRRVFVTKKVDCECLHAYLDMLF
jgi:hypothetical protein